MNKRELLRELRSLPAAERATQVLKNQYYKHDIDVARQAQDVIELHVTGSLRSGGYAHFESFYQQLLPKDKHNKFSALIDNQLPTTDDCDSIFKELKKVFTAQNAEIYLAFNEHEDKVRSESIIDDDTFIQETVWERMQYAPNDIILIKRDEDGSPTTEFISIYNVVDVCANDDGTINYFMYLTEKGKRLYNEKQQEEYKKYIYIDKTSVVELESVKRGKENSNNIIDVQDHGLEWCPAIFSFPKIAHPKLNSALVKSPLLKVISALDWLAFFKISKKYFDSYGAYPIITKFEEKGSMEGDESDEVGATGFFNEPALEADGIDSMRVVPKSPGRSIDSLVGAGAILEIPIPQPGILENMLEAVKIITVPKDNLDWIDEQEVKLAERLFYSVCGKGADFAGKFSASAEQLEISYDSRKTVLADLRVVFERLHKFYVDTIFTMEFPDTYDAKNTNIFYGDTYYLMSESQVIKTYTDFVNSGMPESMKLNQLKTLIYTQYNGSPNELFRALVLLNAEPFPTSPRTEFDALVSNGAIPPQVAYKKYYFNDVIEEFELEMGEISTMKKSGLNNAVAVINNFFAEKYKTFSTENQLNINNQNREQRDENTTEATT